MHFKQKWKQLPNECHNHASLILKLSISTLIIPKLDQPFDFSLISLCFLCFGIRIFLNSSLFDIYNLFYPTCFIMLINFLLYSLNVISGWISHFTYYPKTTRRNFHMQGILQRKRGVLHIASIRVHENRVRSPSLYQSNFG